ncbi:MAG: hypothetical protein AAF828_09465 [Bacteroidota bacterium]
MDNLEKYLRDGSHQSADEQPDTDMWTVIERSIIPPPSGLAGLKSTTLALYGGLLLALVIAFYVSLKNYSPPANEVSSLANESALLTKGDKQISQLELLETGEETSITDKNAVVKQRPVATEHEGRTNEAVAIPDVIVPAKKESAQPLNRTAAHTETRLTSATVKDQSTLATSSSSFPSTVDPSERTTHNFQPDQSTPLTDDSMEAGASSGTVKQHLPTLASVSATTQSSATTSIDGTVPIASLRSSGPPAALRYRSATSDGTRVSLKRKISQLSPYPATAVVPTRPIPWKWERNQQKQARWEVDLTALAFRGEDVFNGFVYSPAPNSNISVPQTFVVDGETRIMYFKSNNPVGVTNYDPIVRLRAIRQMQTGWRFGLGLAYFSQGDARESRFTDQVDQLLTDEFVLGYTYKDNYLLATANVGYTFLRRRRLRPYLDISLLRAFRTYAQETTTLYDRSGSYVQLQLTEELNDTENYVWIPFVEIGLQYQLTKHWQVGVSFYPELSGQVNFATRPGLQLRYNW